MQTWKFITHAGSLLSKYFLLGNKNSSEDSDYTDRSWRLRTFISGIGFLLSAEMFDMLAMTSVNQLPS